MQKKKKKLDTDTFHRILVQMDQRPKYKISIIYLLEEGIGESLGDSGFSDSCLDTTPKSMIYGRKNWKLDFIKSLWFVICTVKKIKKQVTDWEKIFIEQVSDKGLVTKMYFF